MRSAPRPSFCTTANQRVSIACSRDFPAFCEARVETRTNFTDSTAPRSKLLQPKGASRTRRSTAFLLVLGPHFSNKLFTLLSWKVQCGRLTYRLPSLLRLGCGRTEDLAKARTFHERRISPKVPGRRGRLTWSFLTRLGRGGSQFERRQAHAEIELRSSRRGVCRYPYSMENFKEE
jgi:hypothetical protein